MRSFKQYITEVIHPDGSVVAFPHKGKMTTGTVVRYDKGDKHGSPFYVVDHGEYRSATPPAHKVERMSALDEAARKCAGCSKTFNSPGAGKFCPVCAKIDPDSLKEKSVRHVGEVFEPKFQRATKTAVHYTGMINDKTYVVPHSFHGSGDVLHGTKTTEIRHAIVTSPHHIQHNNPDLTPEEVTRIHSHIKDIHGGQDLANLDEGRPRANKHWLNKLFPRSTKNPKGFEEPKKELEEVWLPGGKEKTETSREKEQREAWEAWAKKTGIRVPKNKKKLQEHLYPTMEDLKVDWNSDFTKNRRSNIRRTMQQNLTVKNAGKGNNAWRKADKEDRKPGTVSWPSMSEGFVNSHRIKHGDEVEISHHYGVDSGKHGTVLHPNKVRTNGRGVPTDVEGAYKPVDHKKEHVVKLHDGGYAVVAKGSLTKLKETTMNEAKDQNVFHYHQTKVAKQSLRMPDAMLGVMGGGSKEDARAHLKKMGWSDKEIHRHEHGVAVPFPLKERALTGSEDAKKEEIVHSMKKKLQSFKERYGKDAKSVMYATATKQAKQLAEEGLSPEGHAQVARWMADSQRRKRTGEASPMRRKDTPAENRAAAKTLKQLDEISDKTLRSYVVKAAKNQDLLTRRAKNARLIGDYKKSDESLEKRGRRSLGIDRAVGKMEEGFNQQLDEITKVRKADEAERDPYHSGVPALKRKAVPALTGKARATAMDSFYKTMTVGHAGFSHMEESEQLDELKKSTLKSYINKAATDIGNQRYREGQLRFAGKNRTNAPIRKGHNRVAGIQQAARQLEEMQLKGINVTASRYHPGKTMVMDLDHRRRDKQQRTTSRTSVRNFLKAIQKHKVTKEEVEQLDELKTATLHSYIKKASSDIIPRGYEAKEFHRKSDVARTELGAKTYDKASSRSYKKQHNRVAGIHRAADRLVFKENAMTEETEQLQELGPMTLTSYIKKAARDLGVHSYISGSDTVRSRKVAKKDRGFWTQAASRSERIATKREAGIKSAANRLEEAAHSFMATYHRNENANRHTANIVHVARFFGDKADQEQAKFYADELKKHGHNVHHEAQYELHKKLWPKVLKAHSLTEEAEQLDELSKDTLKSYVGKATGDLTHHAGMVGYIQGKTPYKSQGLRDETERMLGKHELKQKTRQGGIHSAMSKLEEDSGMSFASAIDTAKRYGHKITYGTQSKKWHTIDRDDRDYHTSFALHPITAERYGERASRSVGTSPRRLTETGDNMNNLLVNEEVHAYDVHHKGKHIDTIFYGHHEPVEEVKKSLVNHDGYHPDITVKKQPNKKLHEDVQSIMANVPIADLDKVRTGLRAAGLKHKVRWRGPRLGKRYDTPKANATGFSVYKRLKEECSLEESAQKKNDIFPKTPKAGPGETERERSARLAFYKDMDAKKKAVKEQSTTLTTIKNVLAESATREHFRRVADVISRVSNVKERQELADHNAALFAKENPRFDHAKFHAAAGTVHKKD